MKRYLIERDISGIGNLSTEQLKGVAAKSNGVLAKLAPNIQWLESYVAADRTFCIYLAESEALVFEHAKLGGFPVNESHRGADCDQPNDCILRAFGWRQR